MINEIFYIPFFCDVFEIGHVLFHIYSTSQFKLAPFQVLDSHMWLLATVREHNPIEIIRL